MSVSTLWAAYFHVIKTMLRPILRKQAIQIYEIYFSTSAKMFPVNDCRLDYLVSLHKTLMLTNDAVLSRWFIYGWCTVPIVGTVQWLDGLTHLHHLVSQLSTSLCRCLPKVTPSVFYNLSGPLLNLPTKSVMNIRLLPFVLRTKPPLLHSWFFSIKKLKRNSNRRKISRSEWCWYVKEYQINAELKSRYSEFPTVLYSLL